MKRLMPVIIVLLIIYFILNFVVNKFDKGKTTNYEIGKFNITEKQIKNTKNEPDTYQLFIEYKNKNFEFQTTEKFNKEKIVKEIFAYEKEDLICILPVLKSGSILSDFVCLENETLIYYYNIKNKYSELDTFINSLKIENYDPKTYDNQKTNQTNNEIITLYKGNIVENHNYAMTNYKGLYIMNSKNVNEISNITIFDTDKYNQDIKTFSSKYYVVADYNQEYRFDKFIKVDLTNNKKTEIEMKKEMSFDAYIQGIVDNKIYLFNKDAKRQIAINPNKNKVEEVGDKLGIEYYNNGWEEMKASDAVIRKQIFNTSNITSNEQFERIEIIGNKTGYTYYYELKENNYYVYRSLNGSDNKILLFITPTIKNIIYLDNYLYFIDNKEVKYYNDLTGVRTIIENSELEFNNSIIFYVNT